MSNAWAMRPLVPASVSASSTAAGYAASNVLNDHAGVVWKSAGGSDNVSITVDLGSIQSVSSALFFGCTGAQTTWLLQIEGADNSAFTSNYYIYTSNDPILFLAGSEMPAHGRGVGFWNRLAGGVSRRYWRFTISGLGTAQVTIARLALGLRMALNRNFGFGGAYGVRDLGRVDFSAAGVLLRRRAAKLRTMGISFPSVHKDEVEEKVQPLIELAAGQEAIVIVTDPEAHAQRQKRCWLGVMVGEMGTIWPAAHRWEWRVNLVDLIPIPKAA
jgi:hypothetical protein